MLERPGYQTRNVSSGEAAVEFLNNHTVDLLLLDMIMSGGMNGRETYETIRKIHPCQRAVIISGFDKTDDVRKTLKLGAGQFLNKPLVLETLGLAVKNELNK